MRIAFYGSSLVSSYWNGAATYYRGMLGELARHGHAITFYEPDAYDRQANRDIADPDYATVVVYPATDEGVRAVIAEAARADVVVKASGVGVHDDLLVTALPKAARPDALTVFWDVDAPATLAEMAHAPDHPVRAVLPALDMVLTYGGGPPVVAAYEGFGARRCVPVYNALDPLTHFRVAPDPRFSCDLVFLGNRLPDREARVEHFFLEPAAASPGKSFLLGGSGWHDKPMAGNIRQLGHVSTRDHNALNSTARAALNISRASMADMGYSPATRVFEAAGAGTCLVTDSWTGIELFLRPDAEILVARDGADVAAHLASLTPARARAIGEAARARVLAEHTYARRAVEVDALLRSAVARRRAAA